jgi:hypothetical protein
MRIQQDIEALPMGTLRWNPPKQMKVGSQAVVTAQIGKAPATPTAPAMEGPGSPVSQPTPMTSWMSATLASDDDSALHVEQIEPPKNALDQLQFTVGVAGHEYAEWKWNLTAQRSGTWRLRLTGFVSLIEQDVPVKELPWTTNVPPVDVSVDAIGGPIGSFWSTYWQWVIGTLLATLSLLLAAYLGLRKAGNKTPPPPAAPPPPKADSPRTTTRTRGLPSRGI